MLILPRKRESWPEFFMRLAFTAATRSTCNRRKVGAVAIREKRVIATGYNGAPRGSKHCTGSKCYREQNNIPSGEREERCWAVHAEQNILAQCARFGINIEGCALYCTTKPCVTCLKMLINSGVDKVVYYYDYPSTSFYDEVAESDYIQLVQLSNVTDTFKETVVQALQQANGVSVIETK